MGSGRARLGRRSGEEMKGGHSGRRSAAGRGRLRKSVACEKERWGGRRGVAPAGGRLGRHPLPGHGLGCQRVAGRHFRAGLKMARWPASGRASACSPGRAVTERFGRLPSPGGGFRVGMPRRVPGILVGGFCEGPPGPHRCWVAWRGGARRSGSGGGALGAGPLCGLLAAAVGRSGRVGSAGAAAARFALRLGRSGRPGLCNSLAGRLVAAGR